VNVGILTFHHATNYGAVWQCLSLSQTVRGLGHDVEIIDFRHPIAEKVYRSHLLRSRHAPFNLLKAWRLARDLRQGARLSPTCRTPEDLRKIASRYDAVIVGSDEVWNIEGMRGWTPAYFLDFVPDHVRKISYAASTGHRIDTLPHGQAMRKLLARFNAISVRDETSADIVEDIDGKKPLLVMDPTLLGVFHNPPETNNNLVIYGGLSPHAKKWLREVTRKQNLNVISIGFSNRVGGKIRISAGLQEWMNTIGSANCVITTTFHGVLAAVVHQRPFWVLPRFDPATKVRDLLKAFNLGHRMLAENSLPEELPTDEMVDYGQLAQVLKLRQQYSRNFLTENLE
jgi:hypothetical protein